MYDVKPTVFRTFMQNKGLADKPIPKSLSTPCLVEYRQGDLMLGKVEAISLGELRMLMMMQSEVPKPVNKYWIRGQEWAKDSKGNPIEMLVV